MISGHIYTITVDHEVGAFENKLRNEGNNK